MAETPDEARKQAAAATLNRILAAYAEQRDPIGDSDLDDEQPINLRVYLRLGDIRRARGFVAAAGRVAADFAVGKPTAGKANG